MTDKRAMLNVVSKNLPENDHRKSKKNRYILGGGVSVNEKNLKVLQKCGLVLVM